MMRRLTIIAAILTNLLSTGSAQALVTSQADISAVLQGHPYYEPGCTPGSGAQTGTVTPGAPSGNYIAVGDIPVEGLTVGASIYGGSYSGGSWKPSNDIQGGGSDDTGLGNVGDVKLPGRTAIAELASGSALGGLPYETKVEITYKGKTIVAEKLDIGTGGGSVKGKSRAVDLWWETARLLDFKDGTDVVTIHAVPKDTPVTPIDESATTTTPENSANCVCAIGGAGTPLTGNDNIEKAFNYFAAPDKKLTLMQAAAIVGNLAWESGGVNPKSENSIGAYGIAQWYQGRRTALENFAKDQNKEVTDLGLQLDYLWHELNGGKKSSLDKLRTETKMEDAVINFEKSFEVSGDTGSYDDRIQLAETALRQYGGAAATSGASTVSSSSPTDCTGVGEASAYADNFLVYNQCDSQWANKPYSSSTICRSGCGPSAMAMVITALSGKKVTPVETASYAAHQSLYIPNAGSSWNIAPVLAKRWGLQAQKVGANVDDINKVLHAGGLVVGAGAGALPWTPGGHYIVIRAVTADGKWKVGDSGHSDTSGKEWDPQDILDGIAAGSVYGISQ